MEREDSRGEASAGSTLVSVVIPTYNEAGQIAEALESCLSLSPQPEVIVCDGSSRDHTVTLARAAGVRAIRCRRRGRSFQMNEGVQVAAGEALLFLHADTRVGQEAWDALHKALRDPQVQFGAFRRRFSPPFWVLNLGSYLAFWRGKIAGIFLGDQAIFARAEIFREIGGYRDILLFEDVDLCLRLRKRARGVILPTPVITSSRRFQAEGEWRRFYRNVVLWVRYWRGEDPNELARVYYPDYYTQPARETERGSGAGASPGMRMGAE